MRTTDGSPGTGHRIARERVRDRRAWCPLTAGALACFLLLPASAGAVQDTTPPFWGDLTPGPHRVGFRAILATDESRRYWPADDDRFPSYRPVRIFVWYPASAVADPMRLGDYFAPHGAPHQAYGELEAALLVRDAFMFRFWSAFDEPHAERLYALPTYASQNAQPSAGRHPLILNSLSSGGYQQENVVLWEYLASHGYVVASIPQLHPRWPRIRLGPSTLLENPETQVRDLEYARGVLAGLDFVDTDRTSLLGYSGGSVYALYMALRNEDVRSLVSLDGTITLDNGRRLLDAPHFTPGSTRLPVLNVYKGTEEPDDALMDALERSDRYWVELPETIHMDFMQVPMLNAVDSTGVRSRRGLNVRSHRHARQAYEAMATVVHAFMDATLRVDSGDWQRAMEDLSALGLPAGAAVPQRVLPASDAPSSLALARRVLEAASGPTSGTDLPLPPASTYAGLDANAVAAIGRDFMSHRTPPRARASLILLRIALELDPDNPLRLYDLGDAHLSTAIDPETGYRYWRAFVESAEASGLDDWRVESVRAALAERDRIR